MSPIADKANIMVVDDDPPSLRLLDRALREKGFQVRAFPLGRLALEAAARQSPDLILLDVNMPELSGYETCQRLKQNPQLASVPVIFLTGNDDLEDKVRAFQAGGVDHIGKPVQVEEVYARVRTHLQIRHLQLALEQHNRILEATVEERTRQLRDAHERLTALDDAKNQFLRIISHEVRTPLNGLLGATELAFGEVGKTEAISEVHDLYQRSRHRLLSLVDDALLLSQIDVDEVDCKPSEVPMARLLSRSLERARRFAESRQVQIEAPRWLPGFVVGEEDLLTRALHAMVETAVKFCESKKTMRIDACHLPSQIRLTIDCQGRPLPQHAIDRFFDVLSIGDTLTPGGDLGLGPALSNRILSLFGGCVDVINHESGIRLYIMLARPEVNEPPLAGLCEV